MMACCLLFCFVFCFCFWLRYGACGILVPQPGIEPMPSAVKAWNPNYWTAREFPMACSLEMSSQQSSDSQAWWHITITCERLLKLLVFRQHPRSMTSESQQSF